MPRSATVGLYGKIIFNFVKNCQPLTNNEWMYCFTYLPAIIIRGFFLIFASLKDVQWYHVAVLTWKPLRHDLEPLSFCYLYTPVIEVSV